VLKGWGHEPIMVDTTRVKQLGIGQHGRKNDDIDPEVLARALESDRIPVAHVLSPERQELRYQLSVRRALVEARASTVGTIREIVRSRGLRVKACAAEDFEAQFRKTPLDEATRQLLEPLVAQLATLSPQIAQVDCKLLQATAEEPAMALLATAPGVSLIVAAAFVSVVDQAKRFNRAHELESYLGLVPSENTSGKRRIGSITKQGNSYLRAMLVQAAWCVLRRDPDVDPLARWGKAIAQRRGKRIAAVAVARRLAGVLWAMWKHNTVYDPIRLGRASTTGLVEQAQTAVQRATAMKRAVKKMESYGVRPVV
jgi:transposase